MHAVCWRHDRYWQLSRHGCWLGSTEKQPFTLSRPQVKPLATGLTVQRLSAFFLICIYRTSKGLKNSAEWIRPKLGLSAAAQKKFLAELTAERSPLHTKWPKAIKMTSGYQIQSHLRPSKWLFPTQTGLKRDAKKQSHREMLSLWLKQNFMLEEFVIWWLCCSWFSSSLLKNVVLSIQPLAERKTVHGERVTGDCCFKTPNPLPKQQTLKKWTLIMETKTKIMSDCKNYSNSLVLIETHIFLY